MVERIVHSKTFSTVQVKKTTSLCLIVVIFVSLLFLWPLMADVSEKVIESSKERKIRGALASLDDSNQDVRILGIKKLCKLGGLGKISSDDVEQIAFILQNAESSETKRDVIRVMGNLGVLGKEYISRIVGFLDDKEWFLREEAIRALSNLSEYYENCILEIEPLVSDPDFYVRSVAIEELSRRGKISRRHLPHILPLFGSEYASIRRRAVGSLKSLRELTEEHVLSVIAHLKDDSPKVRKAAAKVLETFEKLSRKHIKKIADLLKHDFLYSRIDSLKTMQTLGRLAEPYIPEIENLLGAPHVTVRIHAIKTLGKLGEPAKGAVPRLGVFLNGDDDCCRKNAIVALGQIGNITAEYTHRIRVFLDSDDNILRAAAVEALGNIENLPGDCVKRIATLLKYENMTVRIAAIKALGKLGKLSADYIPVIVSLLENKNSNVQAAAIRMLANYGVLPSRLLPGIVTFLSENYQHYRSCSEKILMNQSELELKEIIQILNIAYNHPSYIADTRFLLYLLGGDTRKDVEIMLKWLCQPGDNSPTTLSYSEVITTMQVFDELWKAAENFDKVRSDIEKQIVVLASKRKIRWKSDDSEILKTHYNNLQSVDSIHADVLKKVIDDLENPDNGWFSFKLIPLALLIHMVFCGVVLLLYPGVLIIRKGFWNPPVRRIGGLGYVNIALVRSRTIIKRLLKPYRKSLIADALMDEFKKEKYVEDNKGLKVRDNISNVKKNIDDAIPRIEKQIVLEGESDKAKSMFLKYMISRSERCPVYLKAKDCTDGVVQAIEKKIKDISKKRETQVPNFGSSIWGAILNAIVGVIYRKDSFLKKLICRGYIEICIDGMDEVAHSDREKVWKFVEECSRANIIITTQHIEKECPSQVRKFTLLPLEHADI